MQFEQLNKLLSTGSIEDAVLALKIIETKITIEYAIAAACLIRQAHVPKECREQEKSTLTLIHNLLAKENKKVLNVTTASPKAFFEYALSYMRSKEDAEMTYQNYVAFIELTFQSAVHLKLRENYKTG